jgi:hypothetical protein
MNRSVHGGLADGVAIRWHVFGPRLSLFDGLMLGSTSTRTLNAAAPSIVGVGYE